MNAPAELHRRDRGASDVIVARGPLVIMAHGLMSLEPSARSDCWISYDDGRMSAAEAAAALRDWSGTRRERNDASSAAGGARQFYAGIAP